MKKLKLLLLLLIFIFPVCNAGGKEIVWLTADFPPYTIVSGSYKEQGSIDYVHKLVKDELKEYKHIKMVANSKRVFHEIKNRDMVGYPSAIKSKERERYTIFSVPFLLVLPTGVITLKDKLGKFSPFIEKGEFNLKKAVTQSRLILGRSVGRAYGGSIDKIIKQFPDNRNIKIFYKDLFKSSINGLVVGNVDYIVGYPSEAFYFLNKENRIKIVNIHVKGMPEFLLGYYAFPKTKWGNKIVKRVNKVLLKHRNTEHVLKAFERWMDDHTKKLYRKKAEEFFR